MLRPRSRPTTKPECHATARCPVIRAAVTVSRTIFSAQFIDTMTAMTGNVKPLGQRTKQSLVPRDPWELSDSGSMASDTEGNFGTLNAAIPPTTPSGNPTRPMLATKSRRCKKDWLEATGQQADIRKK